MSASPDCVSGSTNVKFGRLVFVDLQLEGSWRLSFPAFITYFCKESPELHSCKSSVLGTHIFINKEAKRTFSLLIRCLVVPINANAVIAASHTQKTHVNTTRVFL